MVHGSMRGTRDCIFPETPDETLREQIAPAPRLFVVGHTHMPLVRTIDETLVVNVDRLVCRSMVDSRVSYAQLTWQHITGRPRSSGWITIARRPIGISTRRASAIRLARSPSLIRVELAQARSQSGRMVARLSGRGGRRTDDHGRIGDAFLAA